MCAKKSTDLSNLFEEPKPYYGFANLAVGNYEIKKFRLVRNKFYNKKDPLTEKKALVVELEDQILFMPTYFAFKFIEDETLIDEIRLWRRKRE